MPTKSIICNLVNLGMILMPTEILARLITDNDWPN